MVASALERRVWTESAMSRVYPNLYVLLVAPPGVGKSMAIFKAREISEATRKLKIAPDDVTKASLIDHLARASQTKVYSATDMLEYHSLAIYADELGVLLPAHEAGFMSVMNALFDNRSIYKESRRGRETDLIITNPQVNLMAGTQPDFLANLLPPEAWGMGFMSRMLMIYSGKKSKPALFGQRVRVDTKDMIDDLKIVCELHGEMDWADDAGAHVAQWYDRGCPPEPEHAKLKHYCPRRILTVLKLSIISSVARGNDMVIELIDAKRAIEWLCEAESFMPEVFKDMSGQSDAQVIQDMHYFVYQLVLKNNNAPIHRSRIDAFLTARTPAWNAEHIVKHCTRAKILIDQGMDMFTYGSLNTTE